MAELDGNTFLTLLGLTSEDEQVKALLTDCGLSRPPKVKRGDVTDVLGSKELGLELTFRDERNLDVKSPNYVEGALVLSNVRMYGGGNKVFQRFAGELPLGLSFDRNPEEAHALLGKPSTANPQGTFARWDRTGYCVFVRTDPARKQVSEVAVQLPVA